MRNKLTNYLASNQIGGTVKTLRAVTQYLKLPKADTIAKLDGLVKSGELKYTLLDADGGPYIFLTQALDAQPYDLLLPLLDEENVKEGWVKMIADIVDSNEHIFHGDAEATARFDAIYPTYKAVADGSVSEQSYELLDGGELEGDMATHESSDLAEDDEMPYSADLPKVTDGLPDGVQMIDLNARGSAAKLVAKAAKDAEKAAAKAAKEAAKAAKAETVTQAREAKAAARAEKLRLMAEAHTNGDGEPHCRMCNKPLSDELSVARGIGATCMSRLSFLTGKSVEALSDISIVSDDDLTDLVIKAGEDTRKSYDTLEAALAAYPEGLSTISDMAHKVAAMGIPWSRILKAAGGNKGDGPKLSADWTMVKVRGTRYLSNALNLELLRDWK